MSESIPIKWSDQTLSYNAVCPDCRKCVFMLTDEAIRRGPRRPTGSSLLLPVTMTAPHDCPVTPEQELADEFNRNEHQ